MGIYLRFAQAAEKYGTTDPKELARLIRRDPHYSWPEMKIFRVLHSGEDKIVIFSPGEYYKVEDMKSGRSEPFERFQEL